MAFKYSEAEYEKDKKKKNKKIASFVPIENTGTDKHFPSDGPGSLLDRRDADYDTYPSDKEYPSGTFPLAKRKKTPKKKKKTRTA